jgi:hypothetical protein
MELPPMESTLSIKDQRYLPRRAERCGCVILT